jgi:hypothetical protein
MALAAVAIFAIAGGVAYAAIPDAGTGLYHACMLKNVGTIRIIDPAAQHCITTLETAITFGAKGDQGPQGIPGANGTNGSNGNPGVSPTVAQLPVSNANCPAGGAAITDAAGHVAYVCSGANGRDGTDGTNGTNGEPFSGTFTSPNGSYSISVTDSGVQISTAAGSSINVTDTDVTLHSTGTASFSSDSGLTLKSGTNLLVQAGSNLTAKANANLNIQASANTTLQSAGSLFFTGSSVGINGGGSCTPAIRLGDVHNGFDGYTGQPVVSSLGPGSTSVCIGG